MAKKQLNEVEKAIVFVSRSVIVVSILFMAVVIIIISILVSPKSDKVAVKKENVLISATKEIKQEKMPIRLWSPPPESAIPDGKEGELIRYGKNLISNTSAYLGPKGKVASISNNMNCQNCHLDAGTKAWGNNYSAVYSTYPKYRDRSGTNESIIKRINDCFERSLNGRALDSNTTEMKAMLAYMKWLGHGVDKGQTPAGAGIQKLTFLKRAADPQKGALVYTNKCQSCHGSNGDGLPNADKTGFIYPPLWGENSYNDGAGLYRISRFAGFVKNNMPLGATYENQQLSDEEAWDVAAFVNSKPRPHKDQSKDWKDIGKKPVDFPFGPYKDNFSEKQHKYGPYEPIVNAKK